MNAFVEAFRQNILFFTMGEKASVEAVGADEKKRRIIVDVARPKGKKLHFFKPKLVEAQHLKNGVGYPKIAMFPGLVGVEVASEISRSLAALGEIDSLVIGLCGNTGGVIGALRVMSLLTPTKIPVGFALAKDRVTPNLDTAKHSFRSVRQCSGVQEFYLVARCQVRPSDVVVVANRT